MDFASVVRRRGNQGPPDKGGYNMFCTLIDRSLPNVHPYGNLAIRADGKEPINGWANSPRIEELRAAWLDTADLEQQKRICVDLQKQLWVDVPFIPMGEYWQATAYRKDLTDVLPGCFAKFYGRGLRSIAPKPLVACIGEVWRLKSANRAGRAQVHANSGTPHAIPMTTA